MSQKKCDKCFGQSSQIDGLFNAKGPFTLYKTVKIYSDDFQNACSFPSKNGVRKAIMVN
jgi:hypothetical protein